MNKNVSVIANENGWEINFYSFDFEAVQSRYFFCSFDPMISFPFFLFWLFILKMFFLAQVVEKRTWMSALKP